METRVAIITGADSNYFSLLDDLLCSLGPQSYGDLFVLDMGLDEDQLDTLSFRCDTAEFISLPYKENPRLVHSNFYKTRLPELIPGYDIYVWVDADIWFQDASVIADLVALGPEDAIAVVPETHPSYDHHPTSVAWREGTYGGMFKPDVAQKLLDAVTINAGLFAMRATSPIWQSWGAVLGKLLEAGPRGYISDQGVLNFLIHMHEVQYKALPAVSNWMAHLALPKWSAADQALCTPDKAGVVIRAIHLTSTAKDMAIPIRPERGSGTTTLRYSDIQRTFKGQIQ